MRATALFFLLTLAMQNIFAQSHERVDTSKHEKGQFIQTKIVVPQSSQSVKHLGTNITDVALIAPLHFIPRNQEINILSAIAPDSGNYLIIWKVTGEDTNSFFPQRFPAAPVDSQGYAYLESKGENEQDKKPFLVKQYIPSHDSLNSRIRFFSLPVECSLVRSLNKNDMLSIKVSVQASLHFISKESGAPPKWINSWFIDKAELILIKE